MKTKDMSIFDDASKTVDVPILGAHIENKKNAAQKVFKILPSIIKWIGRLTFLWKLIRDIFIIYLLYKTIF